jgi:hypothetical protein
MTLLHGVICLFIYLNQLSFVVGKYTLCLTGEFGKSYVFTFFYGKGSRRRCHGRTAALRLIVQPCDEDF